MSAETDSHRRLKIAHVLFVDIVGYSKLLLNEQSEVLDKLNEVVRSTEQVNLAQRVMDCGDAGHILLSKRVAHDLETHERWRPYLHDLGEVTVKHGASIHLVNLYTDDLGEAQVPAKIQRERDAEAVLALRAR